MTAPTPSPPPPTNNTSNITPTFHPLQRIVLRSSPFFFIGMGLGWLLTPAPFLHTRRNMAVVATNWFMVALACFSSREILDKVAGEWGKDDRSKQDILAASAGGIGGFICGTVFGGVRTGRRVAVSLSVTGFLMQETYRWVMMDDDVP